MSKCPACWRRVIPGDIHSCVASTWEALHDEPRRRYSPATVFTTWILIGLLIDLVVGGVIWLIVTP